MKPVPPVESAELKQLKADLKLAQDKTSQLEGAHALLAAKLKEAQTMIATPDTRIVGLTKQNQELSTQLATAQAQTAKLQEQLKVASKPAVPVVPVESPELKQLRTELQRAKDEQAASHNKLDSLLNEKSALDQRYQSVSAKLATAEQKLRTAKPGTERDELVVVKKQLEQSQQRLTVAQEAVEAARAEAKRSQRAAADATAKLSETERQLRAARTASAKNEEIIEQLRKDNANLKRERGQNFVAGPVEEEYTGPTIPELKGWRPHNWPPKAAKPKPAAPATPAATASKQGKVTAAIPAPPKPAPDNKTIAPVPAQPVKPAPAQGSGWWPFGKPAAPVTNQPPAVKAPVKAATD
jgi:hypothetical protein